MATKQKPVGCDFDYGKHSEELQEDWNSYNTYVADTSIAVRLAFIRKVYGVLAIQLGVTTLFIMAAMLIPAVGNFLKQNPSVGLLSSVLSLVMLFPLHIMKDQHPTNIYLLGGWTLLLATMISSSTVRFPATIVCQAFGLTFATVLGLTVYTFKSKKDFSFLEGGLFTGLWILLLVGFLRFFFPFGPAVHLVYSGVGALLFSGFILFDTSSLMRKYSVDDWIPAVITLYLDIVNLFLFILDLLNQRRE